MALIGKQVISYRDDEDRLRYEDREFYRDEQSVARARTYPQGTVLEERFELMLPADACRLSYRGADVSLLGVVMGTRRDERERDEWRVEVCLDATGIDLGASQAIEVVGPRSPRRSSALWTMLVVALTLAALGFGAYQIYRVLPPGTLSAWWAQLLTPPK